MNFLKTEKRKKINIVIFNEDGSVDEEKSTIEWVTREENNNYGTRNERIGATNKIVQKNGKLSKRVLQLSLDGELIKEWESTRECGRNGFCQVAVARCCRGEQKTHKGFRFIYK